MKKKLTLIALALLILFPSISLASGNIRTRNNVKVTQNWTSIATAEQGFGCSIEVSSSNFNWIKPFETVPLDVIMLGRNGNIIWQENKAVKGQGKRTFWCGKDVYEIKCRYNISGGVGEVSCSRLY